MEVNGLEEITLEHIPTLQGMFSAIKSGESSVEELFDPRRGAGRPFEVVANPLKDQPESPSPPTAASSDEGEESGGAQATVSAATEDFPAAQSSSASTESQPAAAATDDALKAAYARGQQARAAGHQRRALPPEFRTPDATRLALCWQAGFDDKPMPSFGKETS
jgi:hypothetical protein